MEKIFSGTAWCLGDHIDTDMIIPSRYLVTDEEKKLGRFAFHDLGTAFVSSVHEGDILVAGCNFGCGSSREHAPLAIRGAGISCIVAESFARTFFRNCMNRGFLVIELPEARKRIRQGDVLCIDVAVGRIQNQTQEETYEFVSIPPFMLEICNQGGLFSYIQRRLEEERRTGLQ